MATGNEINFFFNYILPKPNPNWGKEYQDKYTGNRKFYSCNGNTNYLSYMETGNPKEREKYCETFKYLNGNDKDPLSYMEQEHKKLANGVEKSKGLFDRNGLCDRKTIRRYKKELAQTSGIIWEGIITFESEFGYKYCNKIDQAMIAMQRNFKRFLDSTHLKDRNINWIAALHENTDNRHIHYTFYEKEMWRINKKGEKCYTNKGTVSPESIKYLKQTFYRYFLHESIDLYDFRDNVIEKTRELGADISSNSLHYKKFSKLTETLNMTKPIFRYSELNHSQVETLKDFSYSLIKNDVKLFQLYNETFARLSVVQEDMNNYAGKLGIKPLQSKANYFREDSLKRLGKICLKYCNEVIVMRIKKESEIAKIRRKEIYKNAHSSKLKKSV